MERSAIDRIAALVDDLPALPVVAQQSLAVISDPSTKPEGLQAVLSRDPALSLRVLRLANSAYYRRSRQVNSLTTAIVMLGFKTIQSMVLSSAVHRVLSGAGSAARALWLHCFGAAVACRELSRAVPSAGFDPEEAFLAGLFHDVAKGVIVAKFPGVYARPVTTEGETQALGFHHGHLGQVLLRRWDIPGSLTDAVGTHHEPHPGPIGRMAQVGDWFAWSIAPGIGAEPPPAPAASLETLALDPIRVDQVRATVRACLAEENGEP